jgi:hypothetical protein
LTLLRGVVPKNRGTTFGKDFVPEPCDAPDDGKYDAFSNQDTEHIGSNSSAILTRVEELVSFVESAERRGR